MNTKMKRNRQKPVTYDDVKPVNPDNAPVGLSRDEIKTAERVISRLHYNSAFQNDRKLIPATKVILNHLRKQGNVQSSTKSVCAEADNLVVGARRETYGHPLDDYTCVTAMWRAYLKHKYGIEVPLAPEDGTLMMVMVKLAREAKHPKRDNLVDGCGYFQCTDLIHRERENRDWRAYGKLLSAVLNTAKTK